VYVCQVSHDGYHTSIALLPADNSYLTKWLPVVIPYSGTPEIGKTLLSKACQPYAAGPLFQHKFHKSYVPITDGIPVPTDCPLWSSQS